MARKNTYFAHVNTPEGWRKIVIDATIWHNARDYLKLNYGDGNYWGIKEIGG